MALADLREATLRRFLGDRWAAISAIRVAVGLMLVFLALFVAIFAYFVAIGARQTQERLEVRSAGAAQVVATHAYWLSEVANQTLRRVDAALGPTMSGDAEDIRPALDGLPIVIETFIIDANANTIFSTVPGASDVSVADREYFTAVRDGAAFYTSPMLVSRLTGDQIFVFSKRIERNGAFAGAIMVSYSGVLLEELWQTLDFDTGSTISLVRDDGQLMARFPPAEGPVDLSTLPLFTEFLPAADEGSYTSASSPVDGVARVVSYRKVPETTIVAVASVESSRTWASFTNVILTVVLIASPILLGLALGCWWIVLLLKRDSRQAQELTMLFREIHHRVKNNLQSVQALVRLQDMPEKARQDLQSRFSAMAVMHEHIYQHDRYVDIDASGFIPAVVEQVKIVYGSDVELVFDIAPVIVGHDQATPLALLLNELVTNAFKYAFPASEAGAITIVLLPDEDGYAKLVVSDDGVGMSVPDERGSMGMRLIKGVVAQLEGTCQFRNANGTTFEARLKLSAD